MSNAFVRAPLLSDMEPDDLGPDVAPDGIDTGDCYEATAADTSDLSYVDTGLYDTPGYGSIYVLDSERPAVIETGTGYRHDLIVDAVERAGIDRRSLEVIAVTQDRKSVV